jgi:CubicO group peptidase (beta-lactamase class C family)
MFGPVLSRFVRGSAAYVACVLAPLPAQAQSEPPIVPLTPELRAEIDGYLEQALPRFEVPGAALAIVQDGAVAHVRGAGVRGEQDSTPVDLETRFMIGSLTKSMTALMMATLVDDGLLDWDTPVRDLLPTFSLSDAALAPRVRLRELLSHTSGVIDRPMVLLVERPSPLALIGAVAQFPLAGAPGELFSYSNAAFSLGGFAAARAAGAALADRALERGYEDLMVSRVFERLGMPRTTLDFERAIRGRNHARPHSYSPVDGRQVSPIEFNRFTAPIAPAGAVWSSIADMARYLVVQIRGGLDADGSRVVSAHALLETQSVQIEIPAFGDAGYGLGWGVIGSGEAAQLQHDGSTYGFTARIIASRAQDWGLVLLANRGEAGPFFNAVVRHVSAVLHGSERPSDDDLVALDQERRATLDRAVTATLPVSAHAVEPLIGDYGQGVRVSARGPDLMIRVVYAEQPFRAAPDKADRFVGVGAVETLIAAQFRRGADGAVFLRIGYPDPDGELRNGVELERQTPHAHRHRAARWRACP